jgi:hypothetical protein
MTTSPVLLILELHGPATGVGKGLSPPTPDTYSVRRTMPNASRKLGTRCPHASPTSHSARDERRKNPIQTP